VIHDDVEADSEIHKYFTMYLHLLSGLFDFLCDIFKYAFLTLNEKRNHTSYIVILTLGIIICYSVDHFV